ncbi:MAG: cysteine desulfurase [Victivallales bacterium]|nr:cysteine desulfurase [Victivallales bacterium]
MNIAETNLDPAAAGLPTERELLNLVAELYGEAPAAHVATTGTDWAKIAADVLHEQSASASSEAYSPTLVSAKNATDLTSSGASAQGKLPPRSRATVGSIPIERIRADFPILQERLSSGKQLVWFDNGATTQRPQQVIDRISYYYAHENSNVHRGAHELAARSTDAYENARSTVAKFLGAGNANDIVFVRGTTEGINLVAQSYVRPILQPGDEIIVSMLEHHANIVPWQMIAAATGAKLRVIPVDADGQLILSEYTKLFNSRTKFVSVTHVSNVLGTVTPVAELVAIAHAHGVRILIDGAQSVAHIPVNVTALDPDFYVFSGHKVFGPNGIGAVYGRSDALEEAQPYQGGGNMIADVTFERTIYQAAPNKFEAGTGSIADAVGLGAALEYMMQLGMANIAAYEHELTQYGMERLSAIQGLHLIGTAREKSGVLSFVLDNHDIVSVGKYLDSQGIAVRAGHHCAQPILRHYGLEGTVRPVLAFYNTPEEIDLLAEALTRLVG